MFLDNLDDYEQEQAFARYLASKHGDEPSSPGEVSAIQRAFVREQREREAAERGFQQEGN